MEIRVAGDARIDVLKNDDGYSRAVAAVAHAKGEVLAPFGARETLAAPNYLTVQTGPETHILLAPEHLQYINHSCDPNVFFDTMRMEIVALRAIAAGEEVRFFYPSTEWTMDRAFDCRCGSSACKGRIVGADQLDADALQRYAFNQHILDRLAERLAQAA
ncbi:MAG: SET domain-containing protein-lysine N-methyltransferase [Novosphingobium sp.]|nr:SET domain-containing protein-lysine N-methyltransferase [Novosphingobium sp.]